MDLNNWYTLRKIQSKLNLFLTPEDLNNAQFTEAIDILSTE